MIAQVLGLSNFSIELGNIALSADELRWLKSTCTYLNPEYLEYLKDFRLHPQKQIKPIFEPEKDTGSDEDIGLFKLEVEGLWVETILYEIPLLALTSEAYFRFMDRDWTYDGQEEKAFEKGMQLLEGGCVVSEFGTRRRRDYHTQALVFRGLVRARREGEQRGLKGKISGTSNVHLAMRFGIPPIGTVAHEWFMGVAAITNDYENATRIALENWTNCFGEGVLAIALTDTFGTPAFLKAFEQPLSEGNSKTFAEVFTGVRQDSGDPETFVKTMRKFYDSQNITTPKTIVFSDSLNIELCLQYKTICEAAGFTPSFGIGTFMTNDFINNKTGKKSVPLNIVIKLSSAAGRPAVKISDNAGKNTGDKEKVAQVKKLFGYEEREWIGGNESTRWGTENDGPEAVPKH